MPYRTVSIPVLQGLNEDENPHSLRTGELVRAENCARFGNMVGTRPGVKQPGSGDEYDGDLTGTEPIQGMFEHRENFDEGRHLLAVGEDDAGNGAVYHNHDAYVGDPTTYTATITGGQDNLWVFTQYQNKTWAFGGAASDDIWTFDGVTSNDPAQQSLTDKGTAANLRPKYGIEFRNYLLMNGLRGGTAASNNPAVTRYCDFGTDATTDGNWADGNTIGFSATRPGIPSYGSTYTTGLATYSDNSGDWLLILANRELFGCLLDPTNDFVVADAIANGCSSQRAYVSLGLDSSNAIYMSPNGTIHSLAESQRSGDKADTFLSWKIRPTISTLNRSRTDKAVGAYDFVNGRVIFAVSTGANTSHDTLLCLDVKDHDRITADNARWYIWKLNGVNINELLMARDSSGDWHLYGGTTDGKVIQFADTPASDLGSGFQVVFQTNYEDFGTLLNQKQLGDASITLQPGGNYKPSLKVFFDVGERASDSLPLPMPLDSSGGTWGTFVWGTGTWGSSETQTRIAKPYVVGSGSTISYEFSHNVAAEPFRVGRIDQQVEAIGETAGSREPA